MELVITPYDPDNIPVEEEIPLPDPRFYEAVGGEEGFRELIGLFYDKIVESDIAFWSQALQRRDGACRPDKDAQTLQHKRKT